MAQEGVVAAWQLLDDGLTKDAVRYLARGLRPVYSGVWVSGHAPLSPRQRWWAAILTAPGTVLSHASAGACREIWRDSKTFETVTRPGSGGLWRCDGLVVCRSQRLQSVDVELIDGLPVTSAGRTILDLVGQVGERAGRRLIRDALRTKAVSGADLRAIVARERGRRGVARLRLWTEEYAPLPIERTRSDAEGLALALLEAAGVIRPAVNVLHAGGEADLSWPQWRLIVELDGGSFHQFPTEDARKQRRWEAAGWTVRRLPTDDVYDAPHRLLAAAVPPNVDLAG